MLLSLLRADASEAGSRMEDGKSLFGFTFCKSIAKSRRRPAGAPFGNYGSLAATHSMLDNPVLCVTIDRQASARADAGS